MRIGILKWLNGCLSYNDCVASQRPFKALLFDADGTLYDSSPLHFEAYKRTSRELYDFNFTPELFKEECIGKYKKPTQVLREHGVPCVDADFRALKQPYYETLAAEKLRVTPGLLELLDATSKHGISCAVVTGASRHSVNFSLDLLGIRKYFSVLILQEDTAHQKPHPQPFQLAAQRLGRNPKECCAFEDTAPGVASAKAAGMFCIGIRNGGNTPEELVGADLIVQNFHALQHSCSAGEIAIHMPPIPPALDPMRG